ncbi:hypothetical protein [Streptomyces altiplanensis]
MVLKIPVHGDRVRTGRRPVPEDVGAVTVTWGGLLLPRVDTEDQGASVT